MVTFAIKLLCAGLALSLAQLQAGHKDQASIAELSFHVTQWSLWNDKAVWLGPPARYRAAAAESERIVAARAGELGLKLTPQPGGLTQSLPEEPRRRRDSVRRVNENWNDGIFIAYGDFKDGRLVAYLTGVSAGRICSAIRETAARRSNGLDIRLLIDDELITSVRYLGKLLPSRDIGAPAEIQAEFESLAGELRNRDRTAESWLDLEQRWRDWFGRVLAHLGRPAAGPASPDVESRQ
jgi:hypothetical protein